MKNICRKVILLLAVTGTVVHGAALDARIDLKLAGDGVSDDGVTLERALASGKREVYFPKGVYRLGTVSLPGGTRLKFSPEARILPDGKKFRDVPAIQNVKAKPRAPHRPLFLLEGDDIRIENLRLDAAFFAEMEKGRKRLSTIFFAAGRKNLSFSRLECLNADGETLPWKLPGWKALPNVVELERCGNVTVENSTFENIGHAVNAWFCTNVAVVNNSARRCQTLTTFNAGSSGLLHSGNWSRQVQYQCVFRGGLPSPGRRTERPDAIQDAIPFGSANTVIRGLPPEMTLEAARKILRQRGFGNIVLEDQSNLFYLHGVYDIRIIGNYAEYGTTLCWGNKGRQVLISGNVARFMWDYSYGTEGCDGVIVADNISINSAVAGVMAMYFSENHQISGNLVIVRHEEPYQPEFAENRPEASYYGQFLRLHHGPQNAKDSAAGSCYGAGGVNITGNLFVNELAGRLSGIALEAGRDVRFSGNKVINGFLLAKAERSYIRLSQLQNAAAHDEFATVSGEGGEPLREIVRQGRDLSRITVSDNEFILRQKKTVPQIAVESMLAFCAVKDNVLRREESILRFSAEQLKKEKGTPRLVLPPLKEELPAIHIAPAGGNGRIYVLSNLIEGWARAITPAESLPKRLVVSGNVVQPLR